jgi:hypothetical protein
VCLWLAWLQPGSHNDWLAVSALGFWFVVGAILGALVMIAVLSNIPNFSWDVRQPWTGMGSLTGIEESATRECADCGKVHYVNR